MSDIKEERETILQVIIFGDFVLKYEPKIREITELLSQPFENTIPGLELQIGKLSSKMEFLSWCFAFSEEFVVNAKHKALMPKRKDITDMDREVAMDYSISKETLFRDWLENLNEDIDKYLSNAQSVLSTKRAELMRFGGGD